jgi:5-formyltetrahydrofolate cyclo-ligase
MAPDKATLRAAMHARREALEPADRSQAAIAIAQFADGVVHVAGGKAAPLVSSYWAIGPELDPTQLERALVARGCTLCLPVMVGKAKPLVFRRYVFGDVLVERTWGIREPLAAAAVVTPDILLVPLLAVDATGARLGYGGGFYDRTLRALRADRTITAVGVGYDEQIADAVPTESYDERLDWLLTPAGLKRCLPARPTPSPPPLAPAR